MTAQSGDHSLLPGCTMPACRQKLIMVYAMVNLMIYICSFHGNHMHWLDGTHNDFRVAACTARPDSL